MLGVALLRQHIIAGPAHAPAVAVLELAVLEGPRLQQVGAAWPTVQLASAAWPCMEAILEAALDISLPETADALTRRERPRRGDLRAARRQQRPATVPHETGVRRQLDGSHSHTDAPSLPRGITALRKRGRHAVGSRHGVGDATLVVAAAPPHLTGAGVVLPDLRAPSWIARLHLQLAVTSVQAAPEVVPEQTALGQHPLLARVLPTRACHRSHSATCLRKEAHALAVFHISTDANDVAALCLMRQDREVRLIDLCFRRAPGDGVDRR
mmetsp:Transcript_9164/g.26334  ORF Transcript_9164/g.26334 Transcript_9164/m.26334 type:complete len:268 (+) Transcript_9164:1295-2098(+)